MLFFFNVRTFFFSPLWCKRCPPTGGVCWNVKGAVMGHHLLEHLPIYLLKKTVKLGKVESSLRKVNQTRRPLPQCPSMTEKNLNVLGLFFMIEVTKFVTNGHRRIFNRTNQIRFSTFLFFFERLTAFPADNFMGTYRVWLKTQLSNWGLTGFNWAIMGWTGFYWVFLEWNGDSGVFLGCIEFEKMFIEYSWF